MELEHASLDWSAQFHVSTSQRSSKLVGDKICLPASALEQLLAAAPVAVSTVDDSRSRTAAFDPLNPYSYADERRARALEGPVGQQKLPHPLTFRLVNPVNGRAAYAGILEFSAEEGEVLVSEYLRDSLGIKDNDEDAGSDVDVEAEGGVKITVYSRQLPKGKYVRLRPLEAGYDPEDWKSLLERHLRNNFTTLTKDEILTVQGGTGEVFRFLIDKFLPEGDGICIVDTDLEVDIEALNEEQARETLKQRLAKTQKAANVKDGSSKGGVLTVNETLNGQVLDGEYVDYEVKKWDINSDLEVELEAEDAEGIDLLFSPFSRIQRARPRFDEHARSDFEMRPTKRIRISHEDPDLRNAEALWISVYGYQDASTQAQSPSSMQLRHYSITLHSPAPPTSTISSQSHGPGDVQCKNCYQFIPPQTLFLHENFCLRNNVVCPHCSQVFQKRSTTWDNHWHCAHDSAHGDTASSHQKHELIFHSPHACPCCHSNFSSIPSLANHRVSTCPDKLILCQFCHLLVPQQSPTDPDPASTPELHLSDLTPHEFLDGSRTTECHLCSKITRLRDLANHLKWHELQKLSKRKPRLCRNINCGRLVDGVSAHGDISWASDSTIEDDLGLCKICFGPLYVAIHDPTRKALRRRVERRYLTQLITGCGKGWCFNEFCKTGRRNLGNGTENVNVLTTKDALGMIKPFVDESISLPDQNVLPLHFCVDETSQRRRNLARLLAVQPSTGIEKGKEKMSDEEEFAVEWCVAALESCGNDLSKARAWLEDWAPCKPKE